MKADRKATRPAPRRRKSIRPIATIYLVVVESRGSRKEAFADLSASVAHYFADGFNRTPPEGSRATVLTVEVPMVR